MSLRQLPFIAIGLSLAALVGVIIFWVIAAKQETPLPDQPKDERARVLIHTAAAMRVPAEKAAAEFERDTGIRIEPQFGPSEGILSTLRISKQGDLFLPADESYVAEARKLGLVEEDYPLATLTGVAVFRKDFPKDVTEITWEDMFRDNFRLAQPSADATAIGKLTRKGLLESGLWARIEKAKPATVGTVTEAANAVNLGSADGAIIWDAVAKQYPKLKVVHLPNLERVSAKVTVAVCTNATSRTEARWFAEYLAGPGQKHFKDAGYAPPEARGPKK
jgi:molybdate transport system substrate-binding protein